MKGKTSRERYMHVTNTEKLSKSLLTFVNTLEFFMFFWEILSKRKKCRICCNNFALWKIETIVDLKRQKQPPRCVLKIFIGMFRKLNGFLLNSRFYSFIIFHWYFIAVLIILRDFSFGFFISTSPY